MRCGTLECMTRIAVIGGGQMGEALLAGIIKSGVEPRNIVVAENNSERAEEIGNRYGVLVTDVANAAESSDYVFIAVKPKDVPTVVKPISDVTTNLEKEVVLVSIAAGVPTSFYENLLSAGSPVIRVMPNTPMLVSAGVCAVSAGRYTQPEQLETVSELLAATGTVIEVPESDMDLVTAVSGSGPAYFFLMVESMIEAAVGLGMARQTAAKLAIGTITGSSKMLAETGKSPTELRESVTSPGGTTAAALRAFEDGGFRSVVYDAMEACAEKSAELRPKEPGIG